VLEAIERRMRSDRHESVTLGGPMQIEHVMPQKWRQHWDRQPPLSGEAARERDRLVNTLGNLTLVTQKLNGSLSHRPWTDRETQLVAPAGREAGKGKRSLLSKFSLLVLNKALIDHHPEEWTDSDISKRSAELTRLICQEWPGPQQFGQADHIADGS